MCVVALQAKREKGQLERAAAAAAAAASPRDTVERRTTDPNGSPTTRKQTSMFCASAKIASDSISTISRVARMTSRP